MTPQQILEALKALNRHDIYTTNWSNGDPKIERDIDEDGDYVMASDVHNLIIQIEGSL